MRNGARAVFPRGTEEFSRVLAFSDGLFAIAMTLLVVGISVPMLTNGGDEGELLYLAFIAFLPFPTDVLGNYFENPISVAAYALAVALVSRL